MFTCLLCYPMTSGFSEDVDHQRVQRSKRRYTSVPDTTLSLCWYCRPVRYTSPRPVETLHIHPSMPEKWLKFTRQTVHPVLYMVATPSVLIQMTFREPRQIYTLSCSSFAPTTGFTVKMSHQQRDPKQQHKIVLQRLYKTSYLYCDLSSLISGWHALMPIHQLQLIIYCVLLYVAPVTWTSSCTVIAGILSPFELWPTPITYTDTTLCNTVSLWPQLTTVEL